MQITCSGSSGGYQQKTPGSAPVTVIYGNTNSPTLQQHLLPTTGLTQAPGGDCRAIRAVTSPQAAPGTAERFHGIAQEANSSSLSGPRQAPQTQFLPPFSVKE